MMHGRGKSDRVIVAMKPANKARKAHWKGGRSGVGGAKGEGQGKYAPAKHAIQAQKPAKYGYFCRLMPSWVAAGVAGEPPMRLPGPGPQGDEGEGRPPHGR